MGKYRKGGLSRGLWPDLLSELEGSMRREECWHMCVLWFLAANPSYSLVGQRATPGDPTTSIKPAVLSLLSSVHCRVIDVPGQGWDSAFMLALWWHGLPENLAPLSKSLSPWVLCLIPWQITLEVWPFVNWSCSYSWMRGWAGAGRCTVPLLYVDTLPESVSSTREQEAQTQCQNLRPCSWF